MDPELKKLLEQLGATDATNAHVIIATFNSFLSDIQAASGAADLNAARASVRAVFASLRDLEKTTGKDGAEAIAAALEWRQGAIDADVAATVLKEVLPERALAALGAEPSLKDLVGAVNSDHKERAKNEAKAKIDKACEEGRIRPANRGQLETTYAKFGAEALDLAIASLPEPNSAAAPSTAAAPEQVAPGAVTLNDADRAVAKAMGISEEQALKNKIEWAAATKNGEREVLATA